MVFVKKWRFFKLKFLCKMDQEKVFFEGSERKKSLFRPKKHRLKKLPKFKFFLKWLVYGFCQKMEIF